MSPPVLDPFSAESPAGGLPLTCDFPALPYVLGGTVPPSITDANTLVRGSVGDGGICRCWALVAKHLVDAIFGRGGAGGNRTHLHPIPLHLLRAFRPCSGTVFE